MRFLALDLFAANNTTLKAGGTSVGDRYFSATARANASPSKEWASIMNGTLTDWSSIPPKSSACC